MVKDAGRNSPLPGCQIEGCYKGKSLRPGWVPDADTDWLEEKEAPEAPSAPWHRQALWLCDLPWWPAPCPGLPTPPLARGCICAVPPSWLQAGPHSSPHPCQEPRPPATGVAPAQTGSLG